MEKGCWLGDGFVNGQFLSEYVDVIKTFPSFRIHNYTDSGEKHWDDEDSLASSHIGYINKKIPYINHHIVYLKYSSCLLKLLFLAIYFNNWYFISISTTGTDCFSLCSVGFMIWKAYSYEIPNDSAWSQLTKHYTVAWIPSALRVRVEISTMPIPMLPIWKWGHFLGRSLWIPLFGFMFFSKRGLGIYLELNSMAAIDKMFNKQYQRDVKTKIDSVHLLFRL